jgi:hypothetical protein
MRDEDKQRWISRTQKRWQAAYPNLEISVELEENMSKLDCEDGEEYDGHRCERCGLPDDPHDRLECRCVESAKETIVDGDLELFYGDAARLLADLKSFCELSDKLGVLNDLQRAAIGAAWVALDALFCDAVFCKVDQNEEPF